MTDWATFLRVKDTHVYNALSRRLFRLSDDDRDPIGRSQPSRRKFDWRDFYPSDGIETGDRLSFASPTSEAIRNQAASIIVLDITEECNLRCSYCLYSHNDRGVRLHSSRRANTSYVEAASRLVRDLATSDTMVGFFGGEPLLHFDSVETILRRLTAGRSQHFGGCTLTTNLTVLDDRMIDCFREFAVDLVVSLDGPPGIHDRYRRTASGAGTHSTVLKNLQQLLARDAEYFERHVWCNCVVAPPLDLAALDRFFERCGLPFRGIRFPLVSENVRGMFANYETLHEDFDHWCIGQLKSQSPTSPEGISSLLQYAVRSRLLPLCKPPSTPTTVIPYSSCIPGYKVHVRLDGRLAVCTECEDLTIGDLDRGIDHAAVADLVEQYMRIRQQECGNCWVAGLCEPCFANMVRHGHLSVAALREHCGRFRNTMARWLAFLIDGLQQTETLRTFISESLTLADRDSRSTPI